MSLPSHLTIEIVTPDRAIVHETVDEARLPGAEGYLGVLPGHTPLLVKLQVGEIWFRRGNETTWLHAAFGFAEILPDRIRILARTAEAGGRDRPGTRRGSRHPGAGAACVADERHRFRARANSTAQVAVTPAGGSPHRHAVGRKAMTGWR